jgi:hypothetical protein
MASSVPLAKTNNLAQIFPLLFHYKSFFRNLKPDFEKFWKIFTKQFFLIFPKQLIEKKISRGIYYIFVGTYKKAKI